jgi:predicted porin
MKSSLLVTGSLALFAGVLGNASAQSSVSLYGVVDAAMVHSSNQNGAANTYMRSGNLAGSRIGFKGTEDLGGGLLALFLLENGYDTDTGAQSSSTVLFNRQSYVGLADSKLGTLTAGRQYTPYYLMVGPVGPTSALTGATGAHPGDLDGLDTTVRVNNSLSYTSPAWSGLQVGVLYGMGEQAGSSAAGSSVSAAVKYDRPDWNFALGYQNFKNGEVGGPPASGNYGTSTVTAGYVSADAVQYIAAAARHAIGDLTLGLNASRVTFSPGRSSLFSEKAVFNTGGALAIYKLTPAWSLSGGYSYTKAGRANGIADPATYQQLSFEQTYAFTKRTAFYLLEAYQRADGVTLGKAGGGQPIRAVATVGDSQNATPSSNGRQSVLMAGLRHSF